MEEKTPRRARKRLSDNEIQQLLMDSEDEVENSDTDSESEYDYSSSSSESGRDSGDEDNTGDGAGSSSDGDNDEGNGGGDAPSPAPGAYTYTWTPGSGSHKDIPFTGEEKVNLPKPREQMTIPEMYSLFVSDDIVAYMVQCTNENAQKYLESHQLKRSSRFTKWTPTNSEEMRKFLGLRLWMGLDKKPKFSSYWTNYRLYKNDVAGQVMTRDRFLLLLRFWHFGPDDPSDKLSKIQPLVDRLEEKFAKVKSPGQFLAVDESMIGFRGRLGMRQYNPQKRRKYGIKAFKSCDPSGFTYKYKIYKGKGSHDENAATSLATQVVLIVCEPYLDCGRVVCTDNWYTSMELVDALQERDTHFVGTYRKNRKNIPKEVVAAKLKKGECKFMSESRTGTTALKWKDKRDVYVLSTIYDPDMMAVQSNADRRRSGNRGRARESQKPKMVVEYNKLKGGIDLSDTLLAYHSAERKSIRWYHKVADNLLFGTCVVNAFLLWNTTKAATTPLVHLDKFRETLVEHFLQLENVERVTKRKTHFLEKCEGTEGKTGRVPRGRCRGCYATLIKTMSAKEARNKTKKVQTRCGTCEDKPFFCLPCFQTAHLKVRPSEPGESESE